MTIYDVLNAERSIEAGHIRKDCLKGAEIQAGA